MTYLFVKNWDKFQHYKDRNPPWIKLHQDLLTSEQWVMGNDKQKLLLIAIMVLAARFNNNIPTDPSYIKRVAHLDHTPDVQWLIDVGFCSRSAEQVLRESPWPSRHISETLRKHVLDRDGKKCVACNSTLNLEVDHIIPVSRGGESVIDNLQVLCRSCNRRKRVSVADATQPNAPRRIEAEAEGDSTETEKERDSGRAPEVAPPSKPKRVSGTRLSQDWDLPTDWGQWAEQQGMTPDTVIRECDKFKDYWISKSGANATKADWQATWRNWIRKHLEEYAK